MARSRRSTSKPTAASAENVFICPECRKSFSRAASLGAHRNRAHGVSGASKRRTNDGRSAGAAAAPTRSRRRPRSGQQDGISIDRNQLLRTLFPNGVPPREDVIRRIGNWLDEAEEIAEL
jgi:uncharacterized C2H2 Zn-finger protein